MEKLKTVDIKGKAYVEVSERIRYFNKTYPKGSITTDIVSHNNGIILMRSKVTPDVTEPEMFFTAHSYEKEGSTFINKTSYVENCETSAVGRALGMMGIGIETSIASADEISTAIANQNANNAPKIDEKLKALVMEKAKGEFASGELFKLWRISNGLPATIKEFTNDNFKTALDLFVAKEGA